MKTFISLLVLLVSLTVYSQTFTISGIIKDGEARVLSGVNVTVMPGSTGSSTDPQGKYILKELKMGEEYTLTYTCVGFKPVVRTFKVEPSGPQSALTSHELNITLEPRTITTDQVIVSAGKYEQKLSDLPVSASVLDGRDVLRYNHVNLRDALKYVPGVNVLENQLSIRGSSGYSKGVGTRVLMTIDGLPFHTADAGEVKWETIPVNQIERVEIIKGAASSLYGSTAIGGVINIVTSESPGPFTHISSYIGGYDHPSYEEWDWSSSYRMFNGQSISHSNKLGDLNFTAAFTRREDEGYRRNDFNKRYVGYLKSGLKLSDKNSMSFIFNTLHQYSGSFNGWKDLRHVLEPPDRTLNETITSSRYMGGLISKNKISNSFDISVSGSYYKTIWNDETAAKNDVDADQYRGEIQTNYQAAEDLLLISGAELIYNTVKSNMYGNNDGAYIGLYTQGDYKFDFPLSVTGGLRFDHSSVQSADENALSPRLGLNYKLDENFTFRSAAAAGFRAPSLAERYISTNVSGLPVIPNNDIKAERNFTLEAGVLYSNPFLNFDAAVFRSEYYDLIELKINSAGGSMYGTFDNVIRARIQGFELGLKPKLLNDFNINFSYTFMESEDLNKGTTLRYRPRHLFYSSVNWSKWGFEAGANFRYWSRMEEIDSELITFGIIPEGDNRVPVYVLDVNAGYNFVHSGFPLRVYLNAKNILNYYYVELIGNVAPLRNLALNLELFL